MLEEFKIEQSLAYKILTNSIQKNKISHAYLIESNGYSKKMDFALAVAKFLLCSNHQTNIDNCTKCNICHRIDSCNFTELKIIEPDGLWIKKEQLEQLQEEFSKKSIESDKKIYIINGAEKLNASAANSILKFLEEPEEGIIAILITDNIYQVLETIISRCQVISLNKSQKKSSFTEFSEYPEYLIKLATKFCATEQELKNFVENDNILDQINSIINFANRYETVGKNVILDLASLWNPYFGDKEKMLFGIELLILYYKDMLNEKLNLPLEIYEKEQENYKKYNKNNTQQDICDKIKILLETKNKIRFNANIQLLLDKLIIDFGEVSNGKGNKSII